MRIMVDYVLRKGKCQVDMSDAQVEVSEQKSSFTSRSVLTRIGLVCPVGRSERAGLIDDHPLPRHLYNLKTPSAVIIHRRLGAFLAYSLYWDSRTGHAFHGILAIKGLRLMYILHYTRSYRRLSKRDMLPVGTDFLAFSRERAVVHCTLRLVETKGIFDSSDAW